MNRSPWQPDHVGPGASGLLDIQGLGRLELSEAAIELETWEQTEAKAFSIVDISFTGDEESDMRLTVETSNSIIKALDPATRFTVCQLATEKHCVAVKEGRIELNSAGLTKIYEARQGNFTEAAFIIKGQPRRRICVPTQEFDSWFEQARWTRMLQPWRAGGLAHRMRCRAYRSY